MYVDTILIGLNAAFDYLNLEDKMEKLQKKYDEDEERWTRRFDSEVEHHSHCLTAI